VRAVRGPRYFVSASWRMTYYDWTLPFGMYLRRLCSDIHRYKGYLLERI